MTKNQYQVISEWFFKQLSDDLRAIQFDFKLCMEEIRRISGLKYVSLCHPQKVKSGASDTKKDVGLGSNDLPDSDAQIGSKVGEKLYFYVIPKEMVQWASLSLLFSLSMRAGLAIQVCASSKCFAHNIPIVLTKSPLQPAITRSLSCDKA